MPWPAAWPAAYQTYRAHFNAGQFWAAHEGLEDLWRTQDRHFFLQGLILFAAAFVHVQRSNPAGCRKVMAKAAERLRPYTPCFWGVDVAGLLMQAEGVLALLAQIPAGASLPGSVAYPPMLPLLDDTGSGLP